MSDYYKKHITYGKQNTYGKKITYGKHITYNKPDDELPAGIYASNVNQELTYTEDGVNFTGETFESSYEINYFEVDADGVTHIRTPIVTPLSLGTNPSVTLTSVHGNPSVDVTLSLLDTITVTNTPNEWFYTQSNVQSEVTVSGGAYSRVYQGTRQYVGGYDEQFGWGDYTLHGQHVDPNGAVTVASNDGVITAKYQPKVFITGYRLDGVNWEYGVEPPLEISGYETVDVEYYENADYALDANGQPVYDINGEIGVIPVGTATVELAVPVTPGQNDLIVGNVADSAGESRPTETLVMTRIPAITLNANFKTTIDEETYGTSYTPVNGLTIDAGLSNEYVATPDAGVSPDGVPYLFTSGDYRDYNFTASYTYPTGQSNSVAVVIEYVEFAFQPLDDQDQFYMINDYSTTETLDDVGEFYMINGDI